MSRADESYDVFDNTSNNGGSGGSVISSPIPGSTVAVVPAGRPSEGVINKGPYVVTANAGVQTPGPGLVVLNGRVRVHALSTNTKPVKVSQGRDSIGAELSPIAKLFFPQSICRRFYMTTQVNGEGVEITVKESISHEFASKIKAVVNAEARKVKGKGKKRRSKKKKHSRRRRTKSGRFAKR
jgi:hypothetical protein